MSRVTYGDDSNGPNIFWGGWAKSAMKGKRGQAVFAELDEALKALPQHRLITDEWVADGAVCLLGSLDAYRLSKNLGVSMERAIEILTPRVQHVYDASGEYPLHAFERYMHHKSYRLKTFSDRSHTRANYWFGPLTPEERRLIRESLAAPLTPEGFGSDPHEAAERLGISWVLAWELIERNDEAWGSQTPEERWETAMKWLEKARAEPERAYLFR